MHFTTRKLTLGKYHLNIQKTDMCLKTSQGFEDDNKRIARMSHNNL